MGIDLSLHLTPHSAPHPRDPADKMVASGRGFAPIAWWILFERGDAVMGPHGLALISDSAAALDRLRRRGPEIRAAAGRHALGLRAIEAALQGAGALFLRAELHELYDAVPQDLSGLFNPGRLEVWPLQLDRGRLLMTEQHGGTLADAVVGAVSKPAVELFDLATLEARSLAALRAGDSSELDLLEEALATQIAEKFAPWLPMTRWRWGDGDEAVAATEVLTALVEGRPEPYTALARSHPHFAAHALAEAASRAYERRPALRRALRGATEPLAAPIALALGLSCPSLDALYVAEWLDGGPPPRTVASREAVLACRLASIGAPAWPLSLHDPIAVVERAIGRHADAPLLLVGGLDLAMSRALELSADAARTGLPKGCDSDLDVAARSAAEALCRSAPRIDGPTRAALRDLPAPEAPFLTGPDRACVRLALGDLDVLPSLLTEDATRTAAIVAALRSAAASDRALSWLAERAQAGDLAAAALVLDTPSADEMARSVARAAAVPALRRLAQIRVHHEEGMITTTEFDMALAEIAQLARALGPDGALLRGSLGD